MTCDHCGGNLDVVYDYGRIAREWDRNRLERSTDRTIWAYRPLLPLHEDTPVPALPVGGTPLVRSEALEKAIGLSKIYLKDDTRNPTASFKDRASLVASLRAIESGVRTIATASTGNAASSLAGMAAALGMNAIIFVPESTPEPKLTQIQMYGAELYRVQGSYDDAFELCSKCCKRFGWYSRSTGVNPFTVEGKKTAAFEIAREMNWKAPDWVLVPTGDGNILGGVAKGFRELQLLGWIDRIPRMAAVQAEGSAAIVNAIRSGGEIESVAAKTVADSISVCLPRDGVRAVRAVRETGGAGVSVTDREILEGARELARMTGIFAEPSGAAPLAGLRALRRDGTIKAGETVVLMITGNGLKDTDSAARQFTLPEPIAPELEAVEREIARRSS